MGVTLIVFIIQIVVILVVIFYIYFTFRHGIKIPSAEECIAQISPGLMQLTTDTNNVIFWFYSLTSNSYQQYTLDSEMKITHNTQAVPPPQVRKLNSGYYYNFGLQRWERKTPLTQTPIVDNTGGSIEQKFTLCYLTRGDDDDHVTEICDEARSQTFLKMRISNDVFVWQNNLLTQDIPTTIFPNSGNVCKFTINRYKQYLGLTPTPSDVDNIEYELGVYFEKDDGGVWQLKECSEPDEMKFNGTICIYKTKTRARINGDGGGGGDKLLIRINEGFTRAATYSDLLHTDAMEINSYYIQLNDIYSTCVNLNVRYKVYEFEPTFYKSCNKTIFISGTQSTTATNKYTWTLEQLIFNVTRSELLQTPRRVSPLLEEPLKMFYCLTGEVITLTKPFIIYENNVFYVSEFMLPLVQRITDMKKNYTVLDDFSGSMITNPTLLPHTRHYVLENRRGKLCDCYAIFVGDIIFDMYVRTQLLVDYLPNIYEYEFYQRETFPTIKTDFLLDTWSCAQPVEDTQMFTYISLVDMYGMQELATT